MGTKEERMKSAEMMPHSLIQRFEERANSQ